MLMDGDAVIEWTAITGGEGEQLLKWLFLASIAIELPLLFGSEPCWFSIHFK